jgi:hypothetical protein
MTYGATTGSGMFRSTGMCPEHGDSGGSTALASSEATVGMFSGATDPDGSGPQGVYCGERSAFAWAEPVSHAANAFGLIVCGP